ncbi:hypothetical protein M5V91_11190 [Cytobacillus pseudoceanisediminis]|uniref:hypothetical protein n=1 Tax=Cytobacillus pseudoceanisediminis TaxID=3051614 RepID=UPI00218AD474|nr:hypothetical protein [Cytobacillus pseudoceanisediminis]UQX56135.1 hypothetical protein M5V91_11190 [Cytobacillus pseudoceanisediminis]
MAIKIDVQKTYEEVKIADKIYRMYLNDAKLREYDKVFRKFRKESVKMSERDYSKMTDKEQKSAEKENYEIMFSVVELLLGEGSFEKVYKDTGNSLLVMADIIMQLMEVVGKRMQAFKREKKPITQGNKAYETYGKIYR